MVGCEAGEGWGTDRWNGVFAPRPRVASVLVLNQEKEWHCGKTGEFA